MHKYRNIIHTYTATFLLLLLFYWVALLCFLCSFPRLLGCHFCKCLFLMAQQQRQFQMSGISSAAAGGLFGDTTYTKIFVGGLAWETQRETMRRYFEQFGEIQEAVVITDKNTGRSKGYGFVTFKDADSARRACQDPSPVIDGRRANCNLASLGAAAHRSRPPTPQLGFGRFRPASGSAASAAYHGSSMASGTTGYFHQPTQYAFPYSAYGYSGGYSHENMYPMSYYSVSSGGGGHHQFSPYYAAAPGVFHNFYPYYALYVQSSQGQGGGFGLEYPQMLQYPYFPHHYGAGILSLPASISSTTGMTTTVAAVGSSSSRLQQQQQQQPGTTAEQKPSA